MEDLQSAHPGRSGSDAVRTASRCPGRHVVARHRAPARRQPPVGPKPADPAEPYRAEPHRAEPSRAEPQPGEPETTEPAPAAGGGWRSLLRAVTDRLGPWRERDASDPETPEQGWTVRFNPTWHDWD